MVRFSASVILLATIDGPSSVPPAPPLDYHYLAFLTTSFYGQCLGGGGAAAGPGGAAGAGGGNDAPFKPNGPTKREVQVVSERQEGDGGAGILASRKEPRRLRRARTGADLPTTYLWTIL